MFKIVYVLVFYSMNTPGIAHLQFNTLDECKQTIIDLKEDGKKYGVKINGTCVSMKIPLKKTKCKVINERTHHHYMNGGGYPYPVSLECEEK